MVISPFNLQTERGIRATRSIDIIRRYALGEKVTNICDLHQVSRNTVLRYARMANLPKRPKHFPEKIRNACILMIKSKRSLAAIQARLGVSQAYASKLGKEIGLPRYKRLR